MIRINRIKLSNFMNIKEVDLDFTNTNVIVLSGKNGQGKSAIFDALAFSLSSYKRADKQQDYLRKGATSGNIYIECGYDNHPLILETKMEVCKNTFIIEKIITYKQEVYKNTEAANLLKKLKLDFYSDIFFSMQDGEKISDMTASKRSDYLQEILQINFENELKFIDGYLDNLSLKETKQRGFLESLKSQNDILSKKLSSLVFQRNTISESEYERLFQDLLKLNSEYSELEKNDGHKDNEEITSLNKTLYDINKELKEIDAKREQKKTHDIVIEELKSKISKTEEELKDLYSNAIDRDEYNALCVKANELELNINLLKSKIKCGFSLENKNELYIKLQHVHSELNRLISVKDMTDTEIIEQEKVLFSDLSYLKNSLKDLKEQLSLIKDHSTCPICGNTISDTQVTEFEAKIENINKNIHKKELEIEEFNQLKKDIHDKREYNELLLEYQSDLEIVNEIEKLSEELMSIKKKTSWYTPLFSAIDFKESLLKETNDSYLRELAVTFKDDFDFDYYSNLVSKRDDLKKEVDEKYSKYFEFINNRSKRLSEIYNETRKIQGHIDKYKEVESYNNHLKETRDNNLDIIKTNDSSISECEKNIEQINSEIKVYKEVKKIFQSDLPDYILLSLSKILQNSMNGILQNIFPNFACRLFKEKKGVEFFYTSDVKNSNIDDALKKDLISIKMASGFEKQLLTIAFKISLCKLYGLDFLLMDELDSASDDENSEKLFNTILSSNIFSQLFIITHKPLTKSFVENFSDKVDVYQVMNGQFLLKE